MIPLKELRLGTEPTSDIPISLLCPTQARPIAITRMWHSALATATQPEPIGAALYPDNDECSVSRLSIDNSKSISSVCHISPRVPVRPILKAAYEKAKGDMFMYCGDDLVFRAKNWDAKMISALHVFPDKIA